MDQEIQILLAVVGGIVSIIIIVNQIRSGIYAKKSYELFLEINRKNLTELHQQQQKEWKESRESLRPQNDDIIKDSKFSSNIDKIAKDLNLK